MSDSVDITLILPVHNQADYIEQTVRGHAQTLTAIGASHEILLIPNGCSDNSLQICKALSLEMPAVETIPVDGQGWGRAVKRGIKASKGNLICYTNSARTHSTELHQVLTLALYNQNYVVKAARFNRDNLMRRIGSLIFNLECELLFGLITIDVNGTPKSFPRKFENLLKLDRDDSLIDLEFMLRCRLDGYPHIEVPIHKGARIGGRSTTGMKIAIGLYLGSIFFWWSNRFRLKKIKQ